MGGFDDVDDDDATGIEGLEDIGFLGRTGIFTACEVRPVVERAIA